VSACATGVKTENNKADITISFFIFGTYPFVVFLAIYV
jgi:hypothetical protein